MRGVGRDSDSKRQRESDCLMTVGVTLERLYVMVMEVQCQGLTLTRIINDIVTLNRLIQTETLLRVEYCSSPFAQVIPRRLELVKSMCQCSCKHSSQVEW